MPIHRKLLSIARSQQNQLQRLTGGKGVLRAEGPVGIATHHPFGAQFTDNGEVPVLLRQVCVGIDPGAEIHLRLLRLRRPVGLPQGGNIQALPGCLLPGEEIPVPGQPAHKRIARPVGYRQSPILLPTG